MLAHLLEPGFDVVKRHSLGNVVNKQRSHGAAVVAAQRMAQGSQVRAREWLVRVLCCAARTLGTLSGKGHRAEACATLTRW